ncbi:sodium:proton exchanger [bacterium]|nr:sodium:proton exchanger [bacterium]
MKGPLFVGDLVILFVAAIAAIIVMRLLRLPSIIGYLLAGVLIGPSALGLLGDPKQVKDLAEMGVILLLFTIGLEISPTRLWKLRREAIIGGGLQIAGMVLFGAIGSRLFGFAWGPAVVIGFFLSLSSTAIVLRLLSDRGEMDSPHGRNSLAILLMQDIIVVPMMLMVPMLTGEGSGPLSLLWIFGKAILLIVVVMVLARRAIPWVMDHISALRSREGYLLMVAGIVFSTAWLTMLAGLSPALGAFVAGLVISESEHRHLAMAETVPFRDLFLAVFFVSIGMMLDLRALAADPWTPIALAVGVYLGKGFLIAGIVRMLGYPGTAAFRAGAALGQVGEFSFVILLTGVSAGLIDGALSQALVATAALTMFATTGVMGGVQAMLKRSGEAASSTTPSPEPEEAPPPEDAHGAKRDHVVLIGYGYGGRAMGRTLAALGISFEAIDMNPRTVQNYRRDGVPIILGDATHPDILRDVSIASARAAVVSINDPNALRPILQRVRHEAPNIRLFVRTRFASEISEMLDLGADDVVPDELETSFQIAARLMHTLGVPWDVVRRHLAELRSEGYKMLPSPVPLPTDMALPDGVAIERVTLEDSDYSVGLSLVELNLRRETGASVISLVRAGDTLFDPAHTNLEPGDCLVLSGNESALREAAVFLSSGGEKPKKEKETVHKPVEG